MEEKDLDDVQAQAFRMAGIESLAAQASQRRAGLCFAPGSMSMTSSIANARHVIKTAIRGGIVRLGKNQNQIQKFEIRIPIDLGLPKISVWPVS
jgi:hypothetical protein